MTLWTPAHRFDKRAVALADRHYNRQKPGSPQMMPPGSCKVLVARNSKAVFGLSVPKPEFVKHRWKDAWVVSIFRNEEAGGLASDMIREALGIMRNHYPIRSQGVITFVDPTKVPGIPCRGERVKGFCFREAGFEIDGETKGGLLAWLLKPEKIPALIALPGAVT